MLVIICRHCEESRETVLSDRGREQAKKLGERLKPYTDDRYVDIYTSMAKRAQLTTEIMNEPYFGQVFRNEVLGSDNDGSPVLRQVDRLIAGYVQGADDDETLVLVSHMPIDEVIDRYAKRHGLTRPDRLGYGEAVVINTATKEMTHIPQPK